MGQPSTSNQIRLQLDDASIILPLTKTASKGKSFCGGGEGEGGQVLLLLDIAHIGQRAVPCAQGLPQVLTYMQSPCVHLPGARLGA